MVFINHRDDEVVKAYENELRDIYGFTVSAPYSGTEFDLITGKYIRFPGGRRISEKSD